MLNGFFYLQFAFSKFTFQDSVVQCFQTVYTTDDCNPIYFCRCSLYLIMYISAKIVEKQYGTLNHLLRFSGASDMGQGTSGLSFSSGK